MKPGPWMIPVAATLCMLPLQTLAEETTRAWHFDVSLDGRPIGEHRYLLVDRGDWRELTSDARFRVRLLFFDAFRYQHNARELWRGDCLERIDARTEVNGEHTLVAGQRSGNEFQITAGESLGGLDACVQTFAYWNPRILAAQHLLHPQTGEYVPVQVLNLGREAIAGRDTERFRLVGRIAQGAPLEIDLWYTPAREWVALESRTPDGRRLRYQGVSNARD